jgi:hypothetical protein
MPLTPATPAANHAIPSLAKDQKIMYASLGAVFCVLQIAARADWDNPMRGFGQAMTIVFIPLFVATAVTTVPRFRGTRLFVRVFFWTAALLFFLLRVTPRAG